MTESEPPRKPRGARRWVWAAVAVVLVVAYVGSYSRLRASGTFFEYMGMIIETNSAEKWRVAGGWKASWTEQRTWRTPLFRPCIAVEEWWRNR